MKKFISGLLIGMFLTLSITAFAAIELKIVPNPFPVFVDNVIVDVDGYNINGSTYLKLSDFANFGLGVKYNKNQKQIEISTSQAEEVQQTTEGGNIVIQEEANNQKSSASDQPIFDDRTKAVDINLTGQNADNGYVNIPIQDVNLTGQDVEKKK